MDDKIYGFMHIASVNHYRDIVNEQLDIIDQGLRQKTDAIFCGIVGPDDDFDFIRKRNVHIITRDQDLNRAEHPTIQQLACFSNMVTDAKIWYIHTKGVTTQTEEGAAWRRYMQYFILERYKTCIQTLNNYDVCGVDWAYPGDPICVLKWGQHTMFPYFSGNFWWSTAAHIRKVSHLAQINEPLGRFSAEFNFIGMGDPKVKCLHESGLDLYKHIYPRDRYATRKKFV